MAILGGVWILGSSLFLLTSLFMWGYAPEGRYVRLFQRHFPFKMGTPYGGWDYGFNVGMLTVGWPSVLIIFGVAFAAKLPTAIGRWTRMRKDRRPLPKAKVRS